MKKSILISVLAFVFLVSCLGKIDSNTYSKVEKKGVEISNLAQATLLANVGKAIQKDGPEYAVEFCNLKASVIIDSLNAANNCTISRVTEKNRNPLNKINGKTENELWTLYQSGMAADTVVKVKSHLVYYKPIKIAMQACLKCHGQPGTEIDKGTVKKLKHLYPNDLAQGYQMNELRGLWKIEF
jgi:hypothetical protein